MIIIKRKCLFCTICLLHLLPYSKSIADTADTTFQVSASVGDVCMVSAANLSFGAYDPLAADLTATTTIDVTCTASTTYDIGLNLGTGAGATLALRRMSNGGNTLNYVLYQNPGLTTLWGETVATNTLAGVGDGTEQSITVYGVIPAGQMVTPAIYSDTITVTVTY